MSHEFHILRISRAVALVAALVLVLAGLLAAASPAHAHDALVGSDPAADSTVDVLPAGLTLTFSAAIAPDAGASELQVTDAAGSSLADGAPTVQDNVLTQPLSTDASGATGAVTVLWKVVSSDGHPISGEFSFTVAGAPGPTPTETASPTPTATALPTQTAIAPTLIEDDPNMTVDPVATLLANPLTWLAVAAVVAIIVAIVVARRRRRGPVEPGSGGAADQ